MSYTSCVMYIIKKEEERRFLEAVAQLARNTRMEPGCLEYRFHRNTEDSRKFFLYELYADEQAYRAHQATEHFETWAKGVIPPFLEERRIERYVPFEPGGENEEL
jgi:autoinducer 2-degrading protein